MSDNSSSPQQQRSNELQSIQTSVIQSFTDKQSAAMSATPAAAASAPAPAAPKSHGHGHGGGGNESPLVKFLISGTVAWTFELIIGHYLEFLKISKQTSELSYAQLTKSVSRSNS